MFSPLFIAPLLVTLSCFDGELVQEEAGVLSRSKSLPIAGLQISTVVPGRVRAGSPINLSVKIVNGGKDSFLVAVRRGGLPEFEFELTGKNKKAALLTAYGKKYLRPTDLLDLLRAEAGSVAMVEVAPGEDFDFPVANIALFYDLTLPGEYTLTVERAVAVGDGKSRKTIKLSTQSTLIVEQP